MIVRLACFAFILILLPLDALSWTYNEPPTFSSTYSVEGVLGLPYAEIEEPFIGYFDGLGNRSRVDYYGDLVQTVQRADVQTNDLQGISYKIAYSVDVDGNPQRICFLINGTAKAPVDTQNVLPDLSDFTFVGNEDCSKKSAHFAEGTSCEIWQSSVQLGDKDNKYTFWLNRDSEGNAIPVFYLMMGYDSLLGSHYDEYTVSYHNYQINPSIDEVFVIASNYTCRGFPGPGAQHTAVHSPISEFINNYVDHIDHEFELFKTKHGKVYNDRTHHEQRKTVFRHNYRYIQSKNRENQHFKMAVNHLADFTDLERKALRGRFVSAGYNGGQAFEEHHHPHKRVPDHWDWRLLGAVTPVKDQAVCGSCWSFGTTGTIEGVYFVKTGHLVRLSQQQLIDCSWNEGDNGCDGGEDWRAYSYIQKAGGLATEEDYGHYLGQDGKCHANDVKKVVKLSGFVNVTSGDAKALKVALFHNGPVTIAIDASHKSLSFYANGVYYEPECGNTINDLDHQVLAVGYGTILGQNYWLVKNSWSTYWGNDGYVLMNQKDNNCGVLTQPTYPIIE